jgi:hypothetical protein
VCVCVREREREKERLIMIMHNFFVRLTHIHVIFSVVLGLYYLENCKLSY